MTPTTPTAEPAAAGGRGGGGGQKSEATPIIVDGIMYLPTPNNRVVALDPENAKRSGPTGSTALTRLPAASNIGRGMRDLPRRFSSTPPTAV